MKNIAGLFFFILFSGTGLSQEIEDVDRAFQEARGLAFSSRYGEAKSLCFRILEKSPGYHDVRVLLARVYYWNKQTDSALVQVQHVIRIKPYQDAFIAYADILRWEDQPDRSLNVSGEGLRAFPQSGELAIRKARALHDMERSKEAYLLLDSLLQQDPGNNDLRQLTEQVKRSLSINNVSISYDHDHFDKQFDKDWSLIALSYGRRVKKMGTVTGRINLARRFESRGSQFEVDAYPGLGKKMYMYVNAGYSDSFVFPRYRAGFSLYRNLPQAFEAELGIRLLYFSRTTILYVGSLGKYIGSFWFSLRPTLILCDYGNCISHSYVFITRYYTRSANEYLTLTLGFGMSPDDRARDAVLLSDTNLQSYRARLGYQAVFRFSNIFSVSAGYLREDFFRGSGRITGNNFSFTAGYQKLF